MEDTEHIMNITEDVSWKVWSLKYIYETKQVQEHQNPKET